MAKKGILANSGWNVVGAVLSVGLTFYTTPVFIKSLGLEQYGILAIIAAVTGPLGILNAGVAQSAVKFVAQYSDQGRSVDARAAMLASFVTNGIVGAFGLAVCLVSAEAIARGVFKIAPPLCDRAVLALQLGGAVWMANQLIAGLRGGLEGLRDQRRVVLIDLFSTTLMTLGGVAIAVKYMRIDYVLAAQLSISGLALLTWAIAARSAHGGLTVKWEILRGHLGEVRQYAKWQIVNSLFSVGAGVADRYFVGMLMNAGTLGAYNVALRLQSVSRLAFSGVAQAMLPAASALSSQPGAAERLTVTNTWRVTVVAGILVGFAYVVSSPFLTLWVGAELSNQLGGVVRWLLVAVIVEIPSAICGSYLYATAVNRSLALANMVTSTISIVLMILLGLYWGLSGVAASGFLALVVTRIPFHIWIYNRCFKQVCSLSNFVGAFYGPVAIAIFTAALVSYISDRWIQYESSWMSFGYKATCIGFVYAILFFLLLLVGKGNRARIMDAWRAAVSYMSH